MNVKNADALARQMHRETRQNVCVKELYSTIILISYISLYCKLSLALSFL